MGIALKRHGRIAFAVGFGVLLLLLATASQGFVRDEGYYFRAAREYHAWFENLFERGLDAFADNTLTRDFGYNTEHPGFVKILMGWTWKVAHVWLGAVSGATGFRLGSMVLVAVGAAFTFLFGARLARAHGAIVGLLAVAFLFTSPHVFFHAHLAAFDGPIMGLSVAATYAFWRAASERRWVLPALVLFGVALATKHNAVFLWAGLGLAVMVARGRDWSFSDGKLSLPPLPIAWFLAPIAGLAILYVFYPYGWVHPLQRIGAYYDYHAHHEHYPVDFFGTMYTAPPFPWGYAFRMTALTVPLVTLVLGVMGLIACARRAREVDGDERLGLVLLLVSCLVPPLVISFPSVPIFGGTKHWMPMMPFFCIAAALALMEAVGSIRYRVVAPLVVVAALVMPFTDTIRTHPYGHTYFNELILGHQGAAVLGLPRTFWGGDARPLLVVLNEKAAVGARVYTHRMNYSDWQQYVTDGLARRDLVFVNDVASADWAFVNHQREYQDAEYAVWQLGATRPEAMVAFDGVPIVSLYRLGRAAAR